MASKVNTKFVALIAVGVLLLAGGTVVLYSMVLKTAADHLRAGEAFMARGEYELAAMSFSKAAHKEPNNVENLKKWAEALSKQTPLSVQAYTDRYRDWMVAQRTIAQVSRTNVDLYSQLLDLSLMEARSSYRRPSAWQNLYTQADDYLRQFPETDKQRGKLRRYRGIAMVGKINSGLEVKDADRKACQADLEAALEVDPHDAMAISAWSDLRRAMALRLNQANQQEEGEKIRDATLARLTDFVAANPTLTTARLALVSMELYMMATDAQASGMSQRQFQTLITPKLEALLAAVETEDPKTADNVTAVQVLEMCAGNDHPGAYERGAVALDRLLAAQGEDPFLLLTKVRFQQKTGHASDAVATCRHILALPNRPISTDGILLFGTRDRAAVMLVDGLLGLWNLDQNDTARELAGVTDAAEKAAIIARHQETQDKLLAEARKANADVKSRAAIEDSDKLLCDAKIAIAVNDTAEARKLLGQYNVLTNYSNPEALAMAADTLQRQRLYGAAKDMLRRIVDMRMATPKLYVRLVNIDVQLHNYSTALTWAEAGLALSPGDPELAELKDKLVKLIGGPNSTDPMVRKQDEAQKLLNSTPPDIEGGMKALQEAVALAVNDRQLADLAQVMARINRRADAQAVVDRGLRAYPDSVPLKNLAKALSVADPIPGIVKGIQESNDTPIDKAAKIYLIWAQVGDQVKARASLDEAFKIDPEHAVVVGGMFERYLGEKDYVKAEDMARKAGSKDLDKVGGRLYKARLLQAQGRAAEAVILLQQATDADPSNPLTWRFLGQCYMATGESTKGLRAIRRALDIRPEDPQTIIIHIQALISMNQEIEALNVARDALRFGIAEPAFVDLWLDLEFEKGDQDKAIDRRRRIMEQQPDNLRNGTALATILLRSRRVDDAAKVIAALEGKPGIEDQLTLLKAALHGARGDTPGAEAAFDSAVASIETRLEKDGQKLDGSVHLDFARLVNELDNTQLALSVLERGRKYQNPETAAIDRVLGDTFFAIGKWDEARIAYQRARDAVKEDKGQLLLKRIIECYMRAKKGADAEALLNSMGGANSKDQQVLLLLAQLANEAKDVGRAKELLNKAVALDQQNAVAFRQRAMFNAADPKMAAEVGLDLEQAVRLEPRNTEGRLLLVQWLISKGDMENAKAKLAEGLTLDKSNAAWREQHILLLRNMGQLQEAMASCVEAMSVSANDPRWPQLAGLISQSGNNMKDAADFYHRSWMAHKTIISGKACAEAALAQTPPDLVMAREIINDPEFHANDEPFARLTRAKLAVVEKRNNDAVEDVRAALLIPFGPGKAGFDLREVRNSVMATDECLRVFGTPEDTVAALEKVTPQGGWPDALKLNIARLKLFVPALKAAGTAELDAMSTGLSDKQLVIAASSLLGTITFQDGEAAKAAAKAAEDNGLAAEARAKADEAKAKADQAVMYYQRGLAADKTNAELLNNLAYVLSRNPDKLAEALEFALQASVQDPNNPNILDTLGAIQLTKGELDKAEPNLIRARTLTSDLVTRFMPTVHLIEVKLKQGDRDQADSLYRELEDYYRRDPRCPRMFKEEFERIQKLVRPESVR